ncbi:MAG: hypothetical protein IKW19_05370, partial [Akkermansia sp.]|nr:hypothetical protein [Akkermansia sp.]
MDIEEPFSGEPLTCACPHCGKPLLTMAGLWVQCDEEDARYASVEGLERVCDCEAAREAEEQKRRAQEAAARLARKEQEKLRAQVAWMESELPRAWQDRGLSRWVRETETQQVAY